MEVRLSVKSGLATDTVVGACRVSVSVNHVEMRNKRLINLVLWTERTALESELTVKRTLGNQTLTL